MSIGICIRVKDGVIIASDGMIVKGKNKMWKHKCHKIFKLTEYCGGVFWGATDICASILNEFLISRNLKNINHQELINIFSEFCKKRFAKYFKFSFWKKKIFVGFLLGVYDKDQSKCKILITKEL